MGTFAFVIPAAGNGSRMQDAFPGVPKPLIPLRGRSMIDWVLGSVQASGVSSDVVVVVSEQNRERMQDALRNYPVRFAIQRVPCGTGDAIRCARPMLESQSEHVMVLNADHPLISAGSLRAVADHHAAHPEATMTMGTVELADFGDWRSAFRDWGRVVRSADGAIEGIVESKDCSPTEREITEVNPAIYCFRAAWLWASLEALQTHNSQKEYYLTDLVRMAVNEGRLVETLRIGNSQEVLGANTPEQLALLESIVDGRITVTVESVSASCKLQATSCRESELPSP